MYVKIILWISAAALSTGSGWAEDLRMTSWRKPGISFSQYRSDAIHCNMVGHYTDVRPFDSTKRYVHAQRSMDVSLNGGSGLGYNELNQILRPGERVKEVGKALEGEVEDCLTRNGYKKFALSKDEAKKLSKLKKGTRERHEFLYMLSSRP